MALNIKPDQYSLVIFLRFVNQLKEIDELSILRVQLWFYVFTFRESNIIKKLLINYLRLVTFTLFDYF